MRAIIIDTQEFANSFKPAARIAPIKAREIDENAVLRATRDLYERAIDTSPNDALGEALALQAAAIAAQAKAHEIEQPFDHFDGLSVGDILEILHFRE